MMMKSFRFVFALCLMLVAGGASLCAQNNDGSYYLVEARKAAQSGDFEKADKCYEIYKRMTQRTDFYFERMLEELKATAAMVVPDDDFVEDAFGLNMQMIYVEGPQACYHIGKTEVTQAQWTAVMGTSIAQQRSKEGAALPLYGTGKDYPMYYVSYEEAVEFCRRLSSKSGKNYRLPSEAEWEYAAKGGSMGDRCYYSGSSSMDMAGWWVGNSGSMTHPVASKIPNGFGIYDMSGNVAEWCKGWYSSDSDYRVYRGGSWNCFTSACLIGRRGRILSSRDCRIGFRVVLAEDEVAPAAVEEVVEAVEEVVEDEAIPFALVEEKPSFQGGDANQFLKWVNSKLVYPEIAKENGVQGRVTLQFTVNADGSVSNVQVLRGVDPSLDREAVRVVSNSPKWEPGRLEGVPVNVTYTFPVIFQLN